MRMNGKKYLERNRPLKKKIILLSLLFTLLLSTTKVFALPAESVEPLLKEDYYSRVCSLVRGAKESIYILMYAIQVGESKYHPVNRLCQDLIQAHKRGVKIEIILEYSSAARDKFITEINQKALDLLSKEGIRVRFDDSRRVTHAKLVIIDDYITILGSHNWTYTAFQRNNESSILIKSRKVAQKFLKYFQTIR